MPTGHGQVDYIVGTYSITDKRKNDISSVGPTIADQTVVRTEETVYLPVPTSRSARSSARSRA